MVKVELGLSHPESHACYRNGQPRSERDVGRFWRRVDAETTLFMAGSVACPACKSAGGGREASPERRFHVRHTADYVHITEATDIYQPGWSISAKLSGEFPGLMLFRLCSAPPEPDASGLFRQARGAATMAYRSNGVHLSVRGVASGLCCQSGETETLVELDGLHAAGAP